MSQRHGISDRQPIFPFRRGSRLPLLSSHAAIVLVFLNLLIIGAAALATPQFPPAALAASATCAGDCDPDGTVTVNEVLTMVNIALGSAAMATCPAGDIDGNGVVQISEIIAAVNRALNGCAGPLPTATPDPLAGEGGWCYESSNCFPCDVYPCIPFTTNRAFCCYLVRTTGGTFSWCPPDQFDPSSGACTQCEFPCK